MKCNHDFFGYLEWLFMSSSKVKLWVQNWVFTVTQYKTFTFKQTIAAVGGGKKNEGRKMPSCQRRLRERERLGGAAHQQSFWLFNFSTVYK